MNQVRSLISPGLPELICNQPAHDGLPAAVNSPGLSSLVRPAPPTASSLWREFSNDPLYAQEGSRDLWPWPPGFFSGDNRKSDSTNLPTSPVTYGTQPANKMRVKLTVLSYLG